MDISSTSKDMLYMMAQVFVQQFSSKDVPYLAGGAITQREYPLIENSWFGQIDV